MIDALRPAMLRLDLRLRLAIDAFRSELTTRAQDPLRGLYISEADVDALLESLSSEELAGQLEHGDVRASAPRLAQLARAFDLDSFALEALLISIAPEVDLRYERLFAYLQDDVTRKRPTVDLVMRLLGSSVAAREALGPGGTLVREGLVRLEGGDGETPLLARAMRADERLVEFLLGSDQVDARLAWVAQLIQPPAPEAVRPELRGLVPLLSSTRAPATPTGTATGTGTATATVVYLQGALGTNKRGSLRAVCGAAARTLLLVDVPALLSSRAPTTLLGAAVREAVFQDAVLGLDGFDALLPNEDDRPALRAVLRRGIARGVVACVLLGEARWEPSLWAPEAHPLSLELASTGLSERLDQWRRHVDGQLPNRPNGPNGPNAPNGPKEPNADGLHELAARYRLDEDAIHAATAAARARAAWRGTPQLDLDDLRFAARAIAGPPLEGIAQRLEPRYGWHDIVLPADGIAQLRELCDRARFGRRVLEDWGYARKHARRAGITGLFAGQSGTGKTMAAEIVAGELGLSLYRVDLSATVSKYIGETEKNLERIFRIAEQGDAVLLFDEADALFGRRGEVREAHDRYANIEVAYLLQRLETYDGVAILTTNLRGNIDEAFLRRLECVLEFPMPEEPERLEIWRRSLPAEAPLADDVADGLAFLAGRFRLAGANIRNIALAAAFLAAAEDQAIGMQHLVRATRREYQKLGKLVGESEFERYYPLLRSSQDRRRNE